MSSLHCPQCQALIEQDFGMITCHQCGSMLMVDIEGQIQLASDGTSVIVDEPMATQSPSEYQDLELSVPTEPDEAIPLEMTEVKNFQAEIQAYGNSENSAGLLSYTLIIEGIDTSELRQELKSVLSEAKFKLDVNEIVGKISKGRLEIPSLNATKASLIIQRLRETSLSISWRQHVFSS